ncbi:hypothetical protein [Aeoliella sp.]|uniref:hypothetical protein n=1 Tax=Aeoliella sp. TaxID=2795800 RepID=UPI003CCBF9B9
MSARDADKSIFSAQLWLQPVDYDLDAYREFAHTLDESLAQLVAEHLTRQMHCTRPTPFHFGQADVTNPPEDVLPDEDLW